MDCIKKRFRCSVTRALVAGACAYKMFLCSIFRFLSYNFIACIRFSVVNHIRVLSLFQVSFQVRRLDRGWKVVWEYGVARFSQSSENQNLKSIGLLKQDLRIRKITVVRRIF